MNTATKRKDRLARPAVVRQAPGADGSTNSLRLVVKREGGATLLPVSDIECLTAEGNLVVVHAVGGPYRMRAPLAEMLDRLNGLGFVRIHRGTVVRLAAIVGVEKGAYRKAFALTRSGLRLEIGRAEFARLRALWQPGLLDLAELSRTLRLVADAPLPGA